MHTVFRQTSIALAVLSILGSLPEIAHAQESEVADQAMEQIEALGTSSSSMDSRGSTNNSRSFDFNIFASKLFNQIDVKKSYSADMDEGGIGGTVGLYTAKPFDYDGFRSAISAQAGDNANTNDTSPRIAALVSNTRDKFGALVSVAYSNRNTSEQGYNTYRWRPLDSQGSDSSNRLYNTSQSGRTFYLGVTYTI